MYCLFLFRCKECKKILNLDTYASHQGISSIKKKVFLRDVDQNLFHFEIKAKIPGTETMSVKSSQSKLETNKNFEAFGRFVSFPKLSDSKG